MLYTDYMILLTAAILIIIYMAFVWVWYRLTNNPSVVDVAWSFGLTWVGLLFLLQSMTIRTMIIALVLLTWGFRLGLYLYFTRIYLGKVDKRYLSLSQNWQMNPKLGFFINFQFQGLLIFCLALPFYFAGLNHSNYPNFIELLGLFLAVMGISFETIADQQLQQFKKTHPGKVCDEGLWKYSRHPNYFFEWLIWCGFFLFGLSQTVGWIGVVSPLVLYWLMIYITVPLTELGSLKARGKDYEVYQAKTPMFFPLSKTMRHNR